MRLPAPPRAPACPALACSDPDLTFIGFSWDSSDEVKMRQTFGEGRRELFPRFLDLQQVRRRRRGPRRAPVGPAAPPAELALLPALARASQGAMPAPDLLRPSAPMHRLSHPPRHPRPPWHLPPVLQVGASLGYHGFGLAALTKRVLGFALPKCRKVTMSNWEARQLSARQVQYGALDAVVTGHIFRGLRLWHASPSACTACRQMLGAVRRAGGRRRRCCRDRRCATPPACLRAHARRAQPCAVPAACGARGTLQCTIWGLPLLSLARGR